MVAACSSGVARVFAVLPSAERMLCKQRGELADRSAVYPHGEPPSDLRPNRPRLVSVWPWPFACQWCGIGGDAWLLWASGGRQQGRFHALLVI